MLPRNGDSLRGASPWRCPVSSWRAAQHEPPRRAWRRRRGEQRRQRDADSRRRADPHESTGARPPAGGRRGAAASPRNRLGCRAELFAVDRARRAKQGVRDPRRPENESRIRRDGQCHQNSNSPSLSTRPSLPPPDPSGQPRQSTYATWADAVSDWTSFTAFCGPDQSAGLG